MKRQRAILEEAILKTDMIGGERASERQGKRRKKKNGKNGMIGGGKEPMRAEKIFWIQRGRGDVTWCGGVASWRHDRQTFYPEFHSGIRSKKGGLNGGQTALWSELNQLIKVARQCTHSRQCHTLHL